MYICLALVVELFRKFGVSFKLSVYFLIEPILPIISSHACLIPNSEWICTIQNIWQFFSIVAVKLRKYLFHYCAAVSSHQMQNTSQLYDRMLGSVFLDLSHFLSQCHADSAFGTVNGMKHWIVIKLWIDRRKGWDRRLVFAKI